MKFYEIRFECEDSRDGYHREFCSSKREARKRVAAVRREHAEATAAAAKLRAAGELYCGDPIHKIDDIQVDELEFRGTAKQMILKALRYGA